MSDQAIDQHAVRAEVASARRPYSRPRLVSYGVVSGLTLGGSPGRNDSGDANTHRSVAFYSPYELP
jgi:hypothetical protein